MQLSFNLTSTTCLPGYELQSRGDEFSTCTCQDSTLFILDCDETNNVIIIQVCVHIDIDRVVHAHYKLQMCLVSYSLLYVHVTINQSQ